MRAPSLKSADFQRALGTRPVARTAHFFLYALPHVASDLKRHTSQARPFHPSPSLLSPASQELSTGEALMDIALVDDSGACSTGVVPRPEKSAKNAKRAQQSTEKSVVRLGLVLPKKQARRSVTRSLIRHQVREAVSRHAPTWRALPRFSNNLDAWVLRLRAPFDRQEFPSAASAALKMAVRCELDELWARLAQDQRRAEA